jgi:transcriptional regulator with XRE-family HTH domain
MLPGSQPRRRAALAAFLRNRRERLSPQAAGLPSAGGRRRTPGLRREEVAQLAGVSVAWYTWLEQAREIHPSVEALDAIARALRLEPEDRAHAFALAGREPPHDQPPPLPELAPASVQAVLDALAFPAYVSDRAWNVIAWNALADQLFDHASRAPADRNSLCIAFGDPRFRAMVVNWPDEARHLVANFRRAHDEAPDDPALERVLDRLRGFAEFRRLWASHEVRRRHFARKELRHPTLGSLVFETQSYQSTPLGLRLVIFVPGDARTAERLAAPRRRRRAAR